MTRLAATARARGVSLAIHTHVNAAQSVTPLVAEAARTMLDVGVRDVRNQGVLLHGVNDTAGQLLDLCFALLDGAGVTPYYFYMCDMIPSRPSTGGSRWPQAQTLQHDIMGYLPGFATPRIVCDVPYVGKRWVHQVAEYDRERGISYWTKNYRTGIERTDEAALDRRYTYYDPIAHAAREPAGSGGPSARVDPVAAEAARRRLPGGVGRAAGLIGVTARSRWSCCGPPGCASGPGRRRRTTWPGWPTSTPAPRCCAFLSGPPSGGAAALVGPLGRPCTPPTRGPGAGRSQPLDGGPVAGTRAAQAAARRGR